MAVEGIDHARQQHDFIGIDTPIFTLSQHRLNIAPQSDASGIALLLRFFLEPLRIRQPFGARAQPIDLFTQCLLRLVGVR
ncbi:hypothetical protein D3C81_1971450 [compost metagenome]